MRKVLLFLITLFSVAFIYAQNNSNNAPLTNEDFFTKSDLVFEGYFIKVVATYDTKGEGKFDDIYTIAEHRVEKVYKGDPSLAGNTILIVYQGGTLGEEKIDWGNVEYGNVLPMRFKDRGIPAINATSTSIFFLINSDLPDDENSIYFRERKYKLIDPYGRIYTWGNSTGGLGTFDFQNREELYNSMRQFEGYTCPEAQDWKPGLHWVNGAEQGTSVLESEHYKNLQVKMDSLNNKPIIGIEKDIKKKEQENPNKSPGSETLTENFKNFV